MHKITKPTCTKTCTRSAQAVGCILPEMNLHRPSLDSTWKNPKTGEVRHLVFVNRNGSAETELIQVSGGKETSYGTRSEFANTAKAVDLGDAWTAQGFSRVRHPDRAYESLAHVVALAKLLGYDRVVLPSDPIPQYIPLDQWNGVIRKPGGVPHEYAIDAGEIVAEPVIPAHLRAENAPRSSDIDKLAEWAARVDEALKAAGRGCSFPLMYPGER